MVIKPYVPLLDKSQRSSYFILPPSSSCLDWTEPPLSCTRAWSVAYTLCFGLRYCKSTCGTVPQWLLTSLPYVKLKVSLDSIIDRVGLILKRWTIICISQTELEFYWTISKILNNLWTLMDNVRLPSVWRASNMSKKKTLCLRKYFQELNNVACGAGSVVGIATAYGLDGPGIESRWGEIFRTCPDRPWGPPSLLYNGYRAFPGAWLWPLTPF